MGRCQRVVKSGRRHVILVGPPGSGKSLAGRLLALALGTKVTDVDDLITAEEGTSINRIFELQGEKVFREKEQDFVRRALAAEPHIVVPGGGWAAQPGAMLTSPSAFRIHLRTSPAVALARLQDDHSRPLLQGGKTERMHALIEERLPDYDLADREVVTDGRSIAEVVEVLAALVRSEGGWG